MAAGVKVVGFDSSPAVGAYNVFVNQVDFSGVGVNLADWACELAPNCTGEIAILSATATATNQNQWIDLMKKTLSTDAKYKGLKLVDTVYGDDKADVSTTRAGELLTKYPNLKVIVAPTTVGILAAAQVVQKAGKSATVKVTGLGFPHDMKPFVKDGTSPVYGLWNVPDLGYLSMVSRHPARQRRAQGHRGRDLHGQGPQRRQAVHHRQGQHRHPRAGLPVRWDERRYDLLLGPPAWSEITTPGSVRSPGSSNSEEDAWNASGSRCGSCPGRRPNTGGGTRPSGRRCSTRSGPPACRDYSIFILGAQLFAYLEVDDFAAFRASMAAAPVNDRWQAEMAALIDPMTDPATGFHQRLEEIFHLD